MYFEIEKILKSEIRKFCNDIPYFHSVLLVVNQRIPLV